MQTTSKASPEATECTQDLHRTTEPVAEDEMPFTDAWGNKRHAPNWYGCGDTFAIPRPS